MVRFGADISDVSFAHRLHLHWSDLEHRAPSLRIVCRKGIYVDKPQPGLSSWDCPNLLWELMVARRVKLTAQQLLSRNTSEAIVDKDNHARDAMKYLLMSQPEPSRKSLDRRVAESFETIMETARQQGKSEAEAVTQLMLQRGKITTEEAEDDNPNTYYGRNACHYVNMEQARILREYRGF